MQFRRHASVSRHYARVASGTPNVYFHPRRQRIVYWLDNGYQHATGQAHDNFLGRFRLIEFLFLRIIADHCTANGARYNGDIPARASPNETAEPGTGKATNNGAYANVVITLHGCGVYLFDDAGTNLCFASAGCAPRRGAAAECNNQKQHAEFLNCLTHLHISR